MMARMSKRRPDKRKVRPTKTYSIPEIAELYGKSESTVREWIRRGLPVIDDKYPTLVLGWKLKQWHESWWDARRNPSPSGQIYCRKCQKQRTPVPETVGNDTLKCGAMRVFANCSVCDGRMYKGVKRVKLEEELAALKGQKVQAKRFTGPSTSTSILTHQRDSDSVKNRGSRITHRKADLNLPQNPGNERLKRDYFESPEVVCERGYSEKSIRKDEIALLDFDAHFDYRDFRGLSKTEAITFRQSLLESDLAMPTIISKLKCVQRFLQWLSRQPGYRRKIDTQTLAYLNISKRERRAARVSRSKKFPSYEEFSQTVSKMPGEKPDELRDRAILVTLGLTGIRISALIGLKLKHFDPQRLLFHQDPTEVATKFRKEIYTFILPFDQELGEILLDWVRYLQGELGFGDDDPLFPKSVHRQGLGANFNEYTLSRQHFETTQMPEKKVKSAFEKAGFEAHTPHSLRHMIFHEAITRNWPSGVIVAISQNLGHQVPRISFQGYGQLTLVERGKLIRNAGQITDDEKNRMRMIRDVLREEEKQEKE